MKYIIVGIVIVVVVVVVVILTVMFRQHKKLAWVLASPQGHAIIKNSNPFGIRDDGIFVADVAILNNGWVQYSGVLSGWGGESGDLILDNSPAGSWKKIPNKNAYNLMNITGDVFEVLLTVDDYKKASTFLKNYYPLAQTDLCSKTSFDTDDWVACVTYGALYARFSAPFKMSSITPITRERRGEVAVEVVLQSPNKPDMDIALNGWGADSGTFMLDVNNSGTWKKVNVGGDYIYPLTININNSPLVMILMQASVYEKMLDLFRKAFPLNDLC